MSTVATTCTIEADKTISSSTTTISGTYTLADGTTVVSCTWSNDRGGSGTLTATGESISGTITGLSTGTNTITVVVTDSDGGTGTDSISITYAPVMANSSTIGLTGAMTFSPTGTTTFE